MTKSRQADNFSEPLVDRGGRAGTALRILLLALVLIGAAAAFVVFKSSLDNEMVLGVLGVLAMVGIFFLVSSIIGFIEVMPQRQSDSLARAFLNSHPDGSLITDEKGRIVYANAAYGALDRCPQADRGADARGAAVAPPRIQRGALPAVERPARGQGGP
jgi:two-component system cell cycle sensor histidine kinase/response regulator CckA